MILKGDAILKGKLTQNLKNDINNLVSFHTRSRKSENWQFGVLILSIPHKVPPKKVQKSYLL